jgi:alpha-amylase/alpha-mannosidase (GH57 family)
MTGSEPSAAAKRRHVVIHGHFYQPPRENPWLDIIEKQPSASPYHDWNERIYDQCYRPNAYSRILDPRGMIVDIYNNYLNLSFNFGPTLFRWIEKNHPKTADRIVAADRESCVRFGGHGNAIAQVYNHLIMPLSPRRDQLTQIRWAKSFFQSRFKRETEGIWLAETAINMETVGCLIEEGIRFVVLSPTQTQAFRSLDGSEPWRQTSQTAIDTRRAYRLFARGADGGRTGGHIDVFFFDEGLSREVSFGELLTNAGTLGAKIRTCYDAAAREDQVVVIATDGETFGHHKPFGDMCLAYFFSRIAHETDMEPVNFGFFLEKNPPRHEVMLKNEFGEGTAWSCPHGVGRWARDCGCRSGGPLSWKQEWRSPLRAAFEKLKTYVDESYEQTLAGLVTDPWKLRDSYMAIADARTLKDFKAHLTKLGLGQKLSDEQAMKIRRMCEAQKYMLFSFTSCGWFFSDVSGIETVQNIAYAARALNLAIDQSLQESVTKDLTGLLSRAKSNIPDKDGETIFREQIVPNLRHLAILCFTAIAEKLVSPDRAEFVSVNYYGYHVSLSEGKKVSSEDGRRWELSRAAIENHESGEQADFSVLACSEDGKIRAYAAPSDSPAQAGPHPLTAEGFMRRPDAVPLDLSVIFEEFKVLLAGYFLSAMSKDTQEKYALWMERNETSLESLSGLNVALPSFVAAPIAYVLTAQWNTAINEIEIYGREDEVYDRLLDLWKKTRKYRIALDFTESTRLLQELLFAEVRIFSETLSLVSCDRMRYLLTVVDRFSIPFSKNKIEDIFHSVLKNTIRPMYDQFWHGPDGEQKETVIRLINFARRMNFNTDEFPIS